MSSGEDAAQEGPATLVYERLREVIVRGQLAPGARLVERDIATRLGTRRRNAADRSGEVIANLGERYLVVSSASFNEHSFTAEDAEHAEVAPRTDLLLKQITKLLLRTR